MIAMKLTECEKSFLNYYLNNHNAKWVQVFDNKHPILKLGLFCIQFSKGKLRISQL